MSAWFVDANMFLRFFTQDESRQHDQAAKLFRQAQEGRILLVTGPPVLFEVAWTLRAAYKQPRDVVLDVISTIISLPGLTITDAALVHDALRRSLDSGVEFADAYIMSSSVEEQCAGVATFNKSDFRKLGSKLFEL